MDAKAKAAADELATQLVRLADGDRIEVIEYLLKTSDTCRHCGGEGYRACYCTADD